MADWPVLTCRPELLPATEFSRDEIGRVRVLEAVARSVLGRALSLFEFEEARENGRPPENVAPPPSGETAGVSQNL